MGWLQTVAATNWVQQLEARRLLAVLAPDVSFGIAGAVNVPVDDAIKILPDGKILTVGSRQNPEVTNDSDYETIVSRVNPDGTIDKSFGTGGSINFGNVRIVQLVGSHIFIDRSTTDTLEAYTLDGARDSSFTGNYVAAAIDATPDGGFLIRTDEYTNNGIPQIIKTDAHGKVDPTFGDNGRIALSDRSQQFGGYFRDAVVVSKDGILVPSSYPNALTRYKFDGTIDTSFGTDGKVALNFYVGNLVAQADGKILLLPDVTETDQLVRLNANGSIDTSFGNSGTLVLRNHAGKRMKANNLVLDPQQRIVILADSIYRYSASGVLEAAPFDGTLVQLNGQALHAYVITFDSNGGLFVSGNGLMRFAAPKTVVVGRDHVLYVNGGAGDDTVTIGPGASGNVKVTVNGSVSEVAAEALVGVYANVFDGSNRVMSTLKLPSTIVGGDGADTIVTGDGNDSIRAGGGKDSVVTAGGNDTVIGSNGADTIQTGEGDDHVYEGKGHNVIDCGNGQDRIDLGDPSVVADDNDIVGADGAKTILYRSTGTTNIHLGTGNSVIKPVVASGEVHIVIAGGSNVITLSSTLATLDIGGSGNNKIRVYGKAYVTTGNGNDTFDVPGFGDINSGGGNDAIKAYNKTHGILVDGGAGDDRVINGDAATTVHGGDGNDSITGQGAGQVFWGDGGNDTIRGGSGKDTLDGGGGRDLLYGGAGDDHMAGGPGNDTLHGEAGNDRILGDKEDDQLYGGDGNDTLDGGTGRDYLNGNDGDDIFLAADGEKDSLFGGRGLDHAGYDKGLDVLDGIEEPL